MPAPSSKPKPKGNALTRKVGPLPVWAWLAVSLVLGYVFYKRSSAGASGLFGSSAANTTAGSSGATPASSDLGGLSGGGGTSSDLGGGGGASGADVASALGAQSSSFNAALAGLDADLQAAIAGASANEIAAYQASAAGAATGAAPGGGDFNTGTAPQPGTHNTPTLTHVPALPFGGLVSSRVTSAGVKINTYRNGRIVEKAPGKTAYVAKVSAGSPKRKAKPPARKPTPTRIAHSRLGK